jgi:hypothetical protein
MEVASSNMVFAADKVDAATAPVKDGRSAECKNAIWTPSRGSSPVPAVPTHQHAKVISTQSVTSGINTQNQDAYARLVDNG